MSATAGRSDGVRVLHLVEAAFAGVGRHVLDLVTHQVAEPGWEVDVAYGTSRADAPFLGRLESLDVAEVLTIDGAAGMGPNDVDTIRRLRRHVAERGIDVVHGHASKGGALARLVAMGTGAKAVYTPNALITQAPQLGRVRHGVYRGIEMVLAPLTDHLIHVSDAEAEHARAIGLRPRASSVIPNGIDPVPLPTSDAARAALGLGVKGGDDADLVTIGFVGRLDEQKNLDLLLHAYAALRASGRAAGPAELPPTELPPIELVVIGDGPLRAQHEALADRLAMPGPVRFLGKQPGAASMPAFDVLALPSRYEGFPYVLLEAMAAGVPSVATVPCAADRLFGDGRAGIIADGDPDDPASAARFAAALVELVGDRRRREAASAAALEVSQRFTAAAMARQVAEVYASL